MSITRRSFISSASAAAALLYTGVGRAASLDSPSACSSILCALCCPRITRHPQAGRGPGL